MKIEIDYIESYAIITDFSECRCKTVGHDDGNNTCWKHHDCMDGMCTHTDVDDEDRPDTEMFDD